MTVMLPDSHSHDHITLSPGFNSQLDDNIQKCSDFISHSPKQFALSFNLHLHSVNLHLHFADLHLHSSGLHLHFINLHLHSLALNLQFAPGLHLTCT